MAWKKRFQYLSKAKRYASYINRKRGMLASIYKER